MRDFDTSLGPIHRHSGVREVRERPGRRRPGRGRARCLALGLETLEGRVLLSGGPTIYTVNSVGNGDTGTGNSGTLPYVISQADADVNPAGSRIEFDPTVFSSPQTIALANTLELSGTAGPELIDGLGPAIVTTSGDFAVQVFQVDSGVTATISGLTISGGSTSDSGGGISNDGTLTVTDSTIAGNSALQGGGIFNNAGALTVTDSTIAGNSASDRAGGIRNDGTLAVTDSAITGNSASNDGGGIWNDGTSTVTNCTIAGNSATDGGGIWNSNGTLRVANCTIAGNLTTGNGGTSGGGGLRWDGGTATLNNTIVALNTRNTGSGVTPDDIYAWTGMALSPSSAYNLIGTGGSGGLIDGTDGNQVGVANPGLGTLASNGGPTQTIALLANSPAINTGSNDLAIDPTTQQPLLTDQRGAGFPRIVFGTVDIGAFEFQGESFVVTAQPPSGVIAGSGFGLTVAAEDSSGHVDTSFNGTVTVALANNRDEATLGGTLTVTATNGVATFTGLTLDKVGVGYTLRVSGNGPSGATTSAVAVTPAAATHLEVTSQPVSVGVGIGFGLVVTAEDSFGNRAASYDGTVAVALANNPVGATLGGTLTATATDGVATFAGLTLDKTGAGYALQVSSDGLTAAMTGAFSAWASPSVYTVDLTSASGAGSGDAGDLVYVITQANANTNFFGSIIQFDPAVFSSPQTITLASTLELSETAGPESIDGLGAAIVTISGDFAVQVFQVDSGVTATLSGLTISDGSDGGGSGGAGSGGGIANSGTLSIIDATVSGNFAGGSVSGSGGGVANSGVLSVTDSIFSGNSAGGGLGGGSGGGISNTGTLSVTDSTFSGNSATGGIAGSGSGGAIGNSGTLSITDSTFSGNSAGGGTAGGSSGGGGGGGIANYSGTVSITGCAFNSNSAAGSNPGGGSGGGISNAATLSIIDTTLSNNSAGGGFSSGAPGAASAVASPIPASSRSPIPP